MASTALARTRKRWARAVRGRKRPPKTVEGYTRFNLTKGRSLASYDVDGTAFNPIEMNLPHGMTEVEWMNVGSKLVSVFEGASWWIGDWLIYGVEMYGRNTAFDLAQQATGKQRGTLSAYASICRKIEPELWVAGLSFEKHRWVATLPRERRKPVLEQAVEFGMNDQQIRQLVAEERGMVAPSTRFYARKIKDRMRIKFWIRGEIFSQLQDMIGPQAVNTFVQGLVEDYVFRKQTVKMRREARKKKGNVHGVDITDADVPF